MAIKITIAAFAGVAIFATAFVAISILSRMGTDHANQGQAQTQPKRAGPIGFA